MLNPVLIPVKVMRTPHPKAEEDPWTLDRRTISDPEMRRASIQIGQHQARIGSNPASTADERRLEKERMNEQRATTRVRTPVAAGTSDSIFLMDGVVGMGSPRFNLSIYLSIYLLIS